MGTVTAMPDSTAAGHMAVRVLVALYTIASASGAIMGTNLSLLLVPFTSDIVAQVVMTALVTTLCFFMLAGMRRRAMALVLAIIFLWASYFAILGPNAALSEGSHWRDMVLIAALLLIYADTAHAGQNDISSLVRAFREPRTFFETVRPEPRSAPSIQDLNIRRTSQTTLFHQDLDRFDQR